MCLDVPRLALPAIRSRYYVRRVSRARAVPRFLREGRGDRLSQRDNATRRRRNNQMVKLVQ